MDSYIVRVYRRMPNQKSLIGVVEGIDKDAPEKSFHSAKELWKILLDRPSVKKQVKKVTEDKSDNK